MRKEHTGQVDCPVTSVTEVLTVHVQQFQKRTEPAEFYRKARADWLRARAGLGAFRGRHRQTGSVPGLGWEHLVMVLLSTFKVYLFSSYSLKTQKILDKLIGLL